MCKKKGKKRKETNSECASAVLPGPVECRAQWRDSFQACAVTEASLSIKVYVRAHVTCHSRQLRDSIGREICSVDVLLSEGEGVAKVHLVCLACPSQPCFDLV